MAQRFWVGGGSSTNWAATSNTNWAATSGGTGNQSVPGATDDVFFDGSGNSASNISANISVNTITFLSGYTSTLSHASNIICTVAGNTFTLIGTMTYTPSPGANFTFSSTSGTVLITTTGITLRQTTYSGSGGSYQLQDALTADGPITLTRGTFDANDFNITMTGAQGRFVSDNSNTRTILMGNGTWNIGGTDSGGVPAWAMATGTNLTFSTEGSTLIFSGTTATQKTFAAGSQTYNIVTFSGDNIVVTGSNTYTTMNVNTAGRTNGLKFTNTTTQTITTSFTTNGSSGSLAKLLTTSAGSKATLSLASGGKVCVDFMSIKDSATIGGVWYAGANSTSVSGNTGWIFSGCGITTWLRGGVYKSGNYAKT